MVFREKLSRLTEDRNKSVVSRRAGLGPTALANYVNRGCVPRADIALRIARALNVSIEWLLDDSQNWPPTWMNRADAELEHATAA